MTSLMRLLLILLLACVALPVAAQPKAYAPENLRQLNVPDRVRVIEKEYADQSGGRLIPDDQLEFYLDQIDSGWGFSEIQRDISVSLRGRAWQPPRSGWQPRNVTCSSLDRRYTECRTPFRAPVRLTYQFSDTACIEGRTWGHQPGLIWVDRGCRAQFTEASAGRYGNVSAIRPGDGIVCESREGKKRRCRTDFGGPVRIVEQFSDAPCLEGDTWGWVPGEVWVRRGCRARFVEARGGGLPPSRPGYSNPGQDYGRSSYNVTCASDDDRYRTCAWNPNEGRPVLIEQLSRSACVEGRTWGYDRNGLWVSDGCRARFGTR